MADSSQQSRAGETFLKYGAPWILSGAGSYLGWPAWGNAVAFLLILGMCLGYPQRIKPVEVVLGCSFFLCWLAGNVSTLPWLFTCQPYLTPMLLALLAYGSLVLGCPFTLVYAREWAPREMWHNPHFYRVNRILTALWGAAFLFSALIRYENVLAWPARLALNLAVMFLVACITKWFPEWYRAHVYLKLEEKEITA